LFHASPAQVAPVAMQPQNGGVMHWQ